MLFQESKIPIYWLTCCWPCRTENQPHVLAPREEFHDVLRPQTMDDLKDWPLMPQTLQRHKWVGRRSPLNVLGGGSVSPGNPVKSGRREVYRRPCIPGMKCNEKYWLWLQNIHRRRMVCIFYVRTQKNSLITCVNVQKDTHSEVNKSPCWYVFHHEYWLMNLDCAILEENII